MLISYVIFYYVLIVHCNKIPSKRDREKNMEKRYDSIDICECRKLEQQT